MNTEQVQCMQIYQVLPCTALTSQNTKQSVVNLQRKPQKQQFFLSFCTSTQTMTSDKIPANFFVEFNRDPAEYSSSEILSGSVIVQTETRIPISDITIEICGETNLHWMDHETGLENVTKIEHFSFKQDLIESLSELLDVDGKLLVGTLEMPFKFALPKGLPGNFESEVGWTRYTCVAEIFGNGGERLLQFRALFNVRAESQDQPKQKKSLQCNVNFFNTVYY